MCLEGYFKWKESFKSFFVIVRLPKKKTKKKQLTRGTVAKPAKLNAVNLTDCAFQVNRPGALTLFLRPCRVWDCDIYPIPTLPLSSLSFSQSKNKSVCLLCNCEEVNSVVCERHAPQPEPHWLRTHPQRRHMQCNRL